MTAAIEAVAMFALAACVAGWGQIRQVDFAPSVCHLTRMKLKVQNPSTDPLNLGINAELSVDFSPPHFDAEKEAWATKIEFTGSQGSRDLTIYGATPLQSLLLATRFAMNLYEPDLLGD